MDPDLLRATLIKVGAPLFADGVLLGLARVRGGSLWIPIAKHVLGNLVSIAQSLGGLPH